MIDKIEETYLKYKEIYNNSFSIEDSETRRLLHNSLFLSIFTIFESFLKTIIQNYVKHKVNEKYKITDFSQEIMENILYDHKDSLEKFIKATTNEKQKKSFNEIYNIITTPIEESVLSRYICFKFLHQDVLTTHYTKIFKELLGDAFFLHHFNIVMSKEVLSSLDEKITLSAFDFLSVYTAEVRNAIAHQNDSFASTYSFDESVQAFLNIIKEIYNRYTSHTSYTLTIIKDNLLDEFNH